MRWIRLWIYWTIALAAIFFGAAGIAAYLSVFTSLDISETLVETLATLWFICTLLAMLGVIVGLKLEERNDR